jgi:hypothetical protein
MQPWIGPEVHRFYGALTNSEKEGEEKTKHTLSTVSSHFGKQFDLVTKDDLED